MPDYKPLRTEELTVRISKLFEGHNMEEVGDVLMMLWVTYMRRLEPEHRKDSMELLQWMIDEHVEK